MTDTTKPEALLLHRELLYLAAKNAGTARERMFAALTKSAAELYRQHEELELQKALVAEAQAMTAKVCAENESLREQNTLVDQACARLEAENAALRKEAERYRSVLDAFNEYVTNEQMSTDGLVQYSTTAINHWAFLARAAMKGQV